jgi:hypothetical protein
MPLETSFSVAPYFDDYDETKNFHRVLFQANSAVQARELTQLQTILQNQIERFGTNIYQTGTVIQGCSITFDGRARYVKVLDLAVDGSTVSTTKLANTILTNSSSLQALVIDTTAGLESQNPNLNTLYLKYLNSGTDLSTTFKSGDVLSAQYADYHIANVAIANNGSGYSNSDHLVFTATTGSGAVAKPVTDSSGHIVAINITAVGNNYTRQLLLALQIVLEAHLQALEQFCSLTLFSSKLLLQAIRLF